MPGNGATTQELCFPKMMKEAEGISWSLQDGCHTIESGVRTPIGAPGRDIEFFLSHVQRIGQDQIGEISQNLLSRWCVDPVSKKPRKVEVWVDMEARNHTKQGMAEGVAHSAVVWIFCRRAT